MLGRPPVRTAPRIAIRMKAMMPMTEILKIGELRIPLPFDLVAGRTLAEICSRYSLLSIVKL